MCLIAHVKEPKNFPWEVLARSFKTNSHGAGIMVPVGKKRIHIHRVLPEKWEDVKAMLARYEGKEVAVHLRLKTVGDIDKSNVHPQPILTYKEDGRDMYLMHNGTVWTLPDKGDNHRNDTFHLASGVLRPILKANPDLLSDPSFTKWVESIIGQSRLVIADGETQQFHTFNKDKAGAGEKDGVWFSNSSFRPPVVHHAHGAHNSHGANSSYYSRTPAAAKGKPANKSNNVVTTTFAPLRGLTLFNETKFFGGGNSKLPPDMASFHRWTFLDALLRPAHSYKLPRNLAPFSPTTPAAKAAKPELVRGTVGEAVATKDNPSGLLTEDVIGATGVRRSFRELSDNGKAIYIEHHYNIDAPGKTLEAAQQYNLAPDFRRSLVVAHVGEPDSGTAVAADAVTDDEVDDGTQEDPDAAEYERLVVEGDKAEETREPISTLDFLNATDKEIVDLVRSRPADAADWILDMLVGVKEEKEYEDSQGRFALAEGA